MRYLVLLCVIAGLAGCMPQSAVMKNPKTNETTKCEPENPSLDPLQDANEVTACEKNYAAQGWVKQGEGTYFHW